MTALDATGHPMVGLNDLIDGQKVRRSAIVTLILCTLAMLADGFDIAAMGFIAPELVKDWHVERSALAPVLSASVFGLLFGAPLMSQIGDRFGRKRAIIFTLSVVAVFTLIAMAATSLTQLVVLRFLAGLGLGGLIPNIVALAAEVAPKRLRGVFIIIVNFGVPAGIAAPGWVAAGFVPQFGWPVILFVGGVLPLLVAGLAWLMMDESIRYLLQRGGHDAEVRRIARGLRPDLAIDERTRFASEPVSAALGHGGSPAKLFAGGLAFLTPIVWIALAANQFTNFFTVSWLPLLLQSGGATTAQAGLTASMFATGGLLGGLVLTFIIDRFGALPVVVLFLVGAPMVALIGFANVSPSVMGMIIAAAGFCVTGNNFGMNAVVGMIYPTPVRAKGSGWAQACGRLGALGAQFAGGFILAQHWSMQETFLAPALSLLIGAVAAGILVTLCIRRFGGYRVDDAAPVHAAAPGGMLAQPAKSPG